MSGEFSYFYTAIVKGLSEIEKKRKTMNFLKAICSAGFYN